MRNFIVLASLLILVGCKSDTSEKKETTDASQKNALEDSEVTESFSRGSKIYNNFCATCHLSSGEGIPNTFPPVNNSDWLTEKRKETIRAVKYGLQGPIEVNGEEYDNLMPAMGLSDQEVTDVLNYIFYAWDNNVEEPATLEEVQDIGQ